MVWKLRILRKDNIATGGSDRQGRKLLLATTSFIENGKIEEFKD